MAVVPDSLGPQRFRGFARVALGALEFAQALSNSHRPLAERNITRLVQIFNIEGCHRADRDNCLKAVVDESVLADALVTHSHSLLDKFPRDWKTIPVLPVQSVQCLNGLHRKLAAERFLAPNDQWWTVELFTTGRTT